MREVVGGRLVLDDSVVPGRVVTDDGVITSIVPDEAYAIGPFVVPGFIDVHVHGWGGHDATGTPMRSPGWRGRSSARA